MVEGLWCTGSDLVGFSVPSFVVDPYQSASRKFTGFSSGGRDDGISRQSWQNTRSGREKERIKVRR